MKKVAILTIILTAVLVFSGCSSSTNTSTVQEKKYELSPSIWKSTDGGKTWQVKNTTKTKPPIKDLDVLKVAIDPTNSNNLYVGLRSGGIIRSVDGGDNWDFTDFISEKVYGLDLDPNNGNIIYASGVWQNRGKMFKSEDSGANWKEIYTAAADGPLVVYLMVDKRDSRVIYAATSNNEIIKSNDAGASWKNVYASPATVVKMVMDKSNSQLIYLLTTDGRVMRTKDGGTTFEDISSKVGAGGGLEDLTIDPVNAGGVYVSGKGGIFKSNNGGEAWAKVMALSDPQSFPVSALALSPVNPREIIYGAAQAIYKSVDGGVNWTPFQMNVPKSIHVLTYDPKNPNIVYLGFRK